MTMLPAGRQARPSPELVSAQRAGKAQWRREMATRPFKVKIRTLLEMQAQLLPVIAQRRSLAPWERPWAIEG